MLRLEHLFDRLGQLIERDAPVDHHHALATIFEIMDVGSRADLKSDLLKELEKHRLQLIGYRGNPSISEADARRRDRPHRRRVRAAQSGRRQGGRCTDGQRMADEHPQPDQHSRRHLRIRPAGVLRLAAARCEAPACRSAAMGRLADAARRGAAGAARRACATRAARSRSSRSAGSTRKACRRVVSIASCAFVSIRRCNSFPRSAATD